jgi:hypothetical protein
LWNFVANSRKCRLAETFNRYAKATHGYWFWLQTYGNHENNTHMSRNHCLILRLVIACPIIRTQKVPRHLQPTILWLKPRTCCENYSIIGHLFYIRDLCRGGYFGHFVGTRVTLRVEKVIFFSFLLGDRVHARNWA